MNNLFEDNETFTDNEQEFDTKTLKENLQDYSIKRMSDSVILESHKRATFLVDTETLESFNNLISYQEALNGRGSKFHSDKRTSEIMKNRAMVKGLKSKIVNYAIADFLSRWETENGLLPDVDHIKFKVNGVYHRLYRFNIDGETYLTEQDNRGNETNFLSTEQNSIDEIDEWYNQRLELV